VNTVAPAVAAAAGHRITLTPGLAREALADAYRDAALAGADMTVAVAVLEEIRAALAGGADLFEAWDATSAAVGRSDPGPLRAVVSTLRDRVHAHLLAARLKDLRSLPPGGQERAEAWLTLTAEALIQLRPDLLAAVSSVDVPAAAANVASLVHDYQADLNRSEWGHAYPLFDAVARHDLVPGPLKTAAAARCAEIQLLRLVDPGACRQWLERTSDATPQSALLTNAWGAYWLFRGDLETARKYLLQAVNLDESLASAYTNLAESYEREEDLHAASTWYEACRVHCPGDAEPYLRLLHFYARKDQIEHHRDDLADLIELAGVLSPFAVGDVYFHAAVTYNDLGDTAESDRWIERAIGVDPGRTDTLIWRAQVLADRKQCVQAFAVMTGTWQAAPGEFDVAMAMAALCQTCGRPGEAPAWIERALERRPEAGVKTRVLLAEAYRQAGDLARAEDHLVRSLKLQYDSIEAANSVAATATDCERDQGRGEAETMLRRILDAAGPAWNAWYHNALGDLSFGRPDYAQALTCYQAAADLEPGESVFRHSIAGALRELNRFDEARKAIEDALGRDRDVPWARSDTAWVANAEANYFFGQQDYASAIPLYQEAARLKPQEATIFTNLAGAWDRLDDPQRRREALQGAQAALRTAAELAPDRAAVAVRLAGTEALLAAEHDFGSMAIEAQPRTLNYAARLILPGDLLTVATDPSREMSPEVRTTIAALRTRLKDELNVTLPGITLTDDLTLAEGTTLFEFDGVQVDETESPVHHRFLAETADKLDRAGVPADARSPGRLADGRTGWWIAEAAWDQVQATGLELCSRMAPVLASLTDTAQANAYQMISIDGVATMLGDDRVAEAPAELVGFTAALRLHIAGNLPVSDVGTLWSSYLAERAGAAPLTEAAEALRRLPASLERIGAWCQQRPTAWVGDEREAWFARRSLPLSSGPVLAISAEDLGPLAELVAAPIQAAMQGYLLVTRDASLRPLLAWLFRENQVVATVITDRELPPGVVPITCEAPGPATVIAGAGREAARG